MEESREARGEGSNAAGDAHRVGREEENLDQARTAKVSSKVRKSRTTE